MKDNYTPLPWVLDDDDYTIFSSNKDIAVCYGSARQEFMPSLEERRANAQFIVKACNNYYLLLNACEVALESLYNVPKVGDKYDQQHSDTHMRAILELKDVLGKINKGGQDGNT